MLAEPEDVEPDLIGQFDFLEQVLHPLGALRTLVARIGVHICKGIKAEFHEQDPIRWFPCR